MKIGALLERVTMLRAIVLGFFFASVYYFFVYDSGVTQQSQIGEGQKEIAQAQKSLAEINGKLDKAHEYQRSASEMGEALNKLLSYIPENFRLQDFMKVISEEAKIAGLNIIRIQEEHATDSVEKRPEFEELTVQVEISGTFSQHMTFLSNLTKQKQIFIVEKFRMDKDQGQVTDTESPSVVFRADIKAYRYIGSKGKS